MAPERYLLLGFFKELIDISIKFPGKPGWGNACSHLIDQLILYQPRFISKIEGDYTNDFHEFRLNGAGLKLNWRVVRRGEFLTKNGDECGPLQIAMFQCYIGGDQKKDYPEFVEAAEAFIKKRGVNHR
jgi:hypothetical protein